MGQICFLHRVPSGPGIVRDCLCVLLSVNRKVTACTMIHTHTVGSEVGGMDFYLFSYTSCKETLNPQPHLTSLSSY